MDQEFSVEKQDFTLVKEKIIKTNELLRLYKEKTEKLARASQAFKHLKLNYETAQFELNKFKVDNERLNDALERLKPKHQQTERQLNESQADCARIEDKYQQHIIECQLITTEMERKIKQCNCEQNLLTLSPSKKKTADDKVRELKQKYADLKYVEHQLRTEYNNLTKKYKHLEEKHVNNTALQKEFAVVKDKLHIAESSLQYQSNMQATMESLKERHKIEVDGLKKQISMLSLDRLKLDHLEMECGVLKEQVERNKSKNIQKNDFSTQTDQTLDKEKLKRLEMECAALKEQLNSKHIQRNDFSTQTDQIFEEVCIKPQDTATIETQVSIFDEPTELAPLEDSQKYVGTKKDVKESEDSSDLDCSLSDIFREMIMPLTMLSPIRESSVSPGILSKIVENSSPEKIVPDIIVTPPTPKVELNCGISGLFPILTDNFVVTELDKNAQITEREQVKTTKSIDEHNSISLEAPETTEIIPKQTSSVSAAKNSSIKSKQIDLLPEDAKKNASSSIDELITLRAPATTLLEQENREKHSEDINQLSAQKKPQRRRKFWIPYGMNFVKSRKRLVPPSKAIKKSSSTSDTILNALKTLQENNINFTISNESIPLIQPYNWNAILSPAKSEFSLTPRTLKSTFSCKMGCWNNKCTNKNSLMMLRKDIHQEEPELLGFFNVKDEVITPSASRMALSDKPNNQGIQEFVDKLLTGLKEFASSKKASGSKQKKKFTKPRNRCSEFNSETESELERLFMSSANVLRNNRKLLAAAREQSFESNGESAGEESESDIMGDSGLVTVTPNTVIDDGMTTPVPKDFKNCISGESVLDSSEKKQLTEFSSCPTLISPITFSTPVMLKPENAVNDFKVPKNVVEDSMDSYKTPFCPVLISPMASSTKSSPAGKRTSGEKQSPASGGLKENQVKCSYIDRIRSSLCQKITFDGLESEKTATLSSPISNMGSILADFSIKTSDLNCTLNDINLSQLDCSLAISDHEISIMAKLDDLKENKTRGSKRKFVENDTKTSSDVSNEPLESKRSCLANSEGVLEEECPLRRSRRLKKCDKSPEGSKLVQQEQTKTQSDPPARNLRSRLSYSEQVDNLKPARNLPHKNEEELNKKTSNAEGLITKRITTRSNCEDDSSLKESRSDSASNLKMDPNSDSQMKECSEKALSKYSVADRNIEVDSDSECNNTKSKKKINTKPGRIVSKEFISDSDSDSSVCSKNASKRLNGSSKLNANDALFESKPISPVKHQTITSEIQKILRECSAEETTNQNPTPVTQGDIFGELSSSDNDEPVKLLQKKSNPKKSQDFRSKMPVTQADIFGELSSSDNDEPVKLLQKKSNPKKSQDFRSKMPVTQADIFGDLSSSDNDEPVKLLEKKSNPKKSQDFRSKMPVTQADIFGDLSSSDNDEPVKLLEKKSNPKKSQDFRSKMLKHFKGTIYAANKVCDNSSCAVEKNSVKSEEKIHIVQNIAIRKGNAINLLHKSDKNKRRLLGSTSTSADILSQVMQDMTRTRPTITQTKKIVTVQKSYNNNYHSSLNTKEQFSGKSNADIKPRKAANKVEEDFDPYGDCPKSPDVLEVPDRLPRLIPIEKPKQLSPSKAVMLMDKLMLFATEEKVLDEVIREFAFQTVDYMVEIIIQKLRLDIHDKAEKAYPLSPPMTITQRILLGFLRKLDRSTHPGILDKFLDAAELEVYNKLKCELTVLQPITRLYTAICRMQMDVNRIRRFICNSFYFSGDFAVPTLFIVLTMWPDVLPLQAELSKYPLAKVIAHLCYQKSCNQPGYNLLPLRDMFNKYYGYCIDDWSCEEVFQEILIDYIRNPSIKLSEFTILVFLKNKPVKWVYQKIKDKIMPLYNMVPETNPNLKATLLILLVNIARAFNKFDEFEWSVIQEMNKWFQGLEEGETNLVVLKALQFTRSKLPKRIRKRLAKKETNETQQCTNNNNNNNRVTESASRLLEDNNVSSVPVNNDVSIEFTISHPCLSNDEDSEKDDLEIDSNVNLVSLETNNTVNNVQLSMDSDSSASDIEF